MLNCIIIDDEPLALDLLEDNIRKIAFLNLVGRCKNALEAITLLQSTAVDLVFSDIQMPGLNGLRLTEVLTTKPMFIFITAYEQFALESYNLDVVDYLLKPVALERFIKAANKALERHTLRRALHPEKNIRESPFIFLHVDYSLVKIPVPEISYVESVKDYVRIYFANPEKKMLLVRMSMKGIEAMLPPGGFIRIHKSYLVNFEHLTVIRKNKVFIADIELPVGEQYKDALAKLTGKPF